MKSATNAEEPRGDRLQKILAQAGIASRRAAEQIILDGRVQVNGQSSPSSAPAPTPRATTSASTASCCTAPSRSATSWSTSRAATSPRSTTPKAAPPSPSCSGQDSQKKVIGEHSKMPRLYPVGRLDYLSEGLLLMTNDGELANRLSKASTGVQKTYLVKVSGTPTGEAIDQLRRGIMIDRGRLNETCQRCRPPRPRAHPARKDRSRSAAAKTPGSRSRSPKAATASFARCSKRSATTSRRSAASATAR